MSRGEQKAGYATPAQGGPGGLLRTAMGAISCGIGTGDWSAVAEGQALLEELHDGMHPDAPPYRLD
jgi:hypothetical protein